MSGQIGIIHELGDYCDVEELSPKDQRIVQEQYRRREDDDKKKSYKG